MAGSLAGAGAYAYRSDRRSKRNVDRIGTNPLGLPVYSFQYNDGDAFHIGLMAQDVEKVIPEAVEEIDGVKHVYYDLAGGL